MRGLPPRTRPTRATSAVRPPISTGNPHAPGTGRVSVAQGGWSRPRGLKTQGGAPWERTPSSPGRIPRPSPQHGKKKPLGHTEPNMGKGASGSAQPPGCPRTREAPQAFPPGSKLHSKSLWGSLREPLTVLENLPSRGLHPAGDGEMHRNEKRAHELRGSSRSMQTNALNSLMCLFSRSKLLPAITSRSALPSPVPPPASFLPGTSVLFNISW